MKKNHVRRVAAGVCIITLFVVWLKLIGNRQSLAAVPASSPAITVYTPSADSPPKPAATNINTADVPPASPPSKVNQMREVHEQYVDLVFMPAIAAFHLNTDQLSKLRDLLIQREEAADDTITVVHLKPVGSVLVPDAIARSLADIDQEIINLVGFENAERARGMLEAQMNLGQIANSYAPHLTKQGYTLTPEQRLSLAIVLHETFSSDVNPAARSRETLPINETTGLTALDNTALNRLASVLSPLQLLYMQNSFVETNKVRLARLHKK